METLKCPSCGAPAAAEATRCEYCRATLARVSCPFCFGLLFDGAAFCPHCGHERSRSEVVDGKPVKCPACRGEMKWVRVGAIDLLECASCDGTWVEAAAFERLCADREGQAGMLQHAPALPASPAKTSAQPVRYRPCPRCGKLMNRLNFGRLSGTVVDVCRGHGTFLDRGELHQAVQFILDGGLDRARQAEREQLVEEQHRLRAVESAHAMGVSGEASSTWNSGTLGKFLAALFARD